MTVAKKTNGREMLKQTNDDLSRDNADCRRILKDERARLAYAQYLYKEEEEFNAELIGLLSKSLRHIPIEQYELRSKIEQYINAQKV